MAAAKLEKTRTPGVYKRGSRYVIVFRANGKQVWESYRTYDEARRAKSARQADVERGEFSARSRITLHEYSREWIKRYKGRGRRGFRDRTRDDYERMLEQYVLVFFSPRVRLTEITPLDVARFIDWLSNEKAQAKARHARMVDAANEAGETPPKPLSPDASVVLKDATIRGIVAPLRACLGSATREGLIRANPTRDADLPHREDVEVEILREQKARPFTTEQLAMFLEIVPKRYRLMFECLAVTGLRRSELLALHWEHLHLDGSAPHVKVRHRIVDNELGPLKSKTSRRDVPLSFEMVRALREHRNETKHPGAKDPVFATSNGTYYQPSNLLRRPLKPTAEEVGAPWAGFHTFRHTCASMLIAEGRNLIQIQHWMGHSSPAFTLSRYGHLMDGDVGEALRTPILAAQDQFAQL